MNNKGSTKNIMYLADSAKIKIFAINIHGGKLEN